MKGYREVCLFCSVECNGLHLVREVGWMEACMGMLLATRPCGSGPPAAVFSFLIMIVADFKNQIAFLKNWGVH